MERRPRAIRLSFDFSASQRPIIGPQAPPSDRTIVAVHGFGLRELYHGTAASSVDSFHATGSRQASASATRLAAASPERYLIRPSVAASRTTSLLPWSAARIYQSRLRAMVWRPVSQAACLYIAALRGERLLLPPSLFEHPAAELSADDSAQLCEDRRQPDHIA
jgi:hypothetical protein